MPCEEINFVLDDVKDGAYDGKPQLWWTTQTLASKQIRRWLNMPDDARGVKFALMKIPVDDYPLQMNDIITHIGPYQLSNLGKVDIGQRMQVSYRYAVDKLIDESETGDGPIPIKILRDGVELEMNVPLFRDGQFLMNYMFDTPPTYFVYGPIVFGVATAEFSDSIDLMLSKGGSSAKAASTIFGIMQRIENPYLLRRYDRAKVPDEQLVVVNKLISNRMTRDIKVLFPAVIRTINGQPVPNVRAAAEIVQSLEDDSIVIEFDDNLNTTIVLDRDEIEKEKDEIMENNGIVNSASKNLRDVWTR